MFRLQAQLKTSCSLRASNFLRNEKGLSRFKVEKQPSTFSVYDNLQATFADQKSNPQASFATQHCLFDAAQCLFRIKPRRNTQRSH
jgi:hypothetical protein